MNVIVQLLLNCGTTAELCRQAGDRSSMESDEFQATIIGGAAAAAEISAASVDVSRANAGFVVGLFKKRRRRPRVQWRGLKAIAVSGTALAQWHSLCPRH